MDLKSLLEASYASDNNRKRIIAEHLAAGLAGTGVMDDYDEILYDYVEHPEYGMNPWTVVDEWNICFEFINEATGQNLGPISDEDVEGIIGPRP